MKLLITGGAGMVGSHAAEYFAQAPGNKVIVLDNLVRSKIFSSKKKSVEYNWQYLKSFKNIVLEKKDICDSSVIERCFKKHKPDVVIHAASQPGVRFSLEHPQEDFEINCLGTLNVLESFRRHNSKGTFIYCSTNKVYGYNVNKERIVEGKTQYCFRDIRGIGEKVSIDLTGHTPYGVSKLGGDLYVQEYARVYGMKTAVFRMSCVYGTRQFGFEDHGWIAWFILQVLKGKPITIFGNGKQVRDVLWVGDLVSAFDKFICSGLRYEVFNIGGGMKNTLSLLDLVAILERQMRKKVPIRFKGWRKFDQKVYASDIAKVKKFLHWAPHVSPEEGIKRLIVWTQNQSSLTK